MVDPASPGEVRSHPYCKVGSPTAIRPGNSPLNQQFVSIQQSSCRVLWTRLTRGAVRDAARGGDAGLGLRHYRVELLRESGAVWWPGELFVTSLE